VGAFRQPQIRRTNVHTATVCTQIKGFETATPTKVTEEARLPTVIRKGSVLIPAEIPTLLSEVPSA
jgi:hypothetical protein